MSVSSKEIGRATIVVWFFVILMSVLLVRLNSANEQAGAKTGLVGILVNATPFLVVAGFAVVLVRGTRKNDTKLVAAFRTGIGYDLHRLEANGGRDDLARRSFDG